MSEAPWVVHCDGSALPNPGRMGLGVVMTEPGGARHTLSVATHLTGCNNEAELRALMAALGELKARGATSLLVRCDSRILVEQLAGPQAKAIARLHALFDEARALLASFEHVQLQWIPQHRNGDADELARAALGLPPRAPKWPAKASRRRKP